LGLKPLVVPQRGFADYTGELQKYDEIRTQNGYQPANCALLLHIVCVEKEDEIADACHSNFHRAGVIN
jgi:hypothetical protein